MNVTVIGTGFVGVVSAAVYASFGNDVIGLDIDEKKVTSLKKSVVPFYEPKLSQLLKDAQADNKLHFTTDYEQAISQAEIIIVAVGTPSNSDGTANLEYVHSALKSLAPHLKSQTVVVIKSTVPPDSFSEFTRTLDAHTDAEYALCSVPEFLREGSAVDDTLNADRVVIGSPKQWATDKLIALHEPINAPVVVTSVNSAQLSKYAANAYLATRITFINQMANLCKTYDADIQEVIKAFGYDKRIGDHYWYPGLGYGGSCFPKDVKALSELSKKNGDSAPLFGTIHQLNAHRPLAVLKQFEHDVDGWSGKKIAFLGLSFKPNTDDLREAPSTVLIPALLEAGARVVGFDPKASQAARSVLPEHERFSIAQSIENACESADVIMAVIEWPEIISHDYSQHKNSKPQWFIDYRNQFSPSDIQKVGFTYLGIGR